MAIVLQVNFDQEGCLTIPRLRFPASLAFTSSRLSTTHTTAAKKKLEIFKRKGVLVYVLALIACALFRSLLCTSPSKVAPVLRAGHRWP